MRTRPRIPDALFTPYTATRCRGVYKFGNSYYAKVKVARKVHRLGSFRDLPSAVARVEAWYKERFGPSWQQFAHARESNPWKIVRGRAGAGSGRYLLIVYLFGSKRRVDPPGAIGWATKEAAAEARPLILAPFIRGEMARLGLPTELLRAYPVLWRCVGGREGGAGESASQASSPSATSYSPPPPPPGAVWWTTGNATRTSHDISPGVPGGTPALNLGVALPC